MSQHQVEEEPQSAFDWHMEELFNNPPYSHCDMVRALVEGRFIIEGQQSNFSDAELFCQQYSKRKDVWNALADEGIVL